MPRSRAIGDCDFSLDWASRTASILHSRVKVRGSLGRIFPFLCQVRFFKFTFHTFLGQDQGIPLRFRSHERWRRVSSARGLRPGARRLASRSNHVRLCQPIRRTWLGAVFPSPHCLYTIKLATIPGNPTDFLGSTGHRDGFQTTHTGRQWPMSEHPPTLLIVYLRPDHEEGARYHIDETLTTAGIAYRLIAKPRRACLPGKCCPIRHHAQRKTHGLRITRAT